MTIRPHEGLCAVIDAPVGLQALWFQRLLQRLINRRHGEADSVRKLLAADGVPFTLHRPPKFLRVLKFSYDFTRAGRDKDVQERWWVRSDPQAFTRVIDTGEFMHLGYLPSGNSLPGMPLVFQTKDRGQLASHCLAACSRSLACRAFTYQPSHGICYLKNVSLPAKGLDCVEDCWFHGYVQLNTPGTLLGRVSWILKPVGWLRRNPAAVVTAAAVLLVVLWLCQIRLLRSLNSRLSLRIAKPLGSLAVLALFMSSGVYMAAQLHLYTLAFLAVCAVGLAVAGYMYHIERKLETELWYEPMCDINQKISCSKAANSEYSKMFIGIPNALVGLYFYAAMLVLLLSYLLSHCYLILLLITAAAIAASVLSRYLG